MLLNRTCIRIVVADALVPRIANPLDAMVLVD